MTNPSSGPEPGVASLGMYDLPELRAANDALWEAIRRGAGIAAASGLIRDRNLEEIWTAPDLVLAQTCGYPLMTGLAGRVTLVATPVYDVEGCEGAWYRSAIVVRRDDPALDLAALKGARCVINDWTSNSGMNLLRAAVAPLSGGRAYFREVTVSGAHLASAEIIARGEADVAAIDCVTWAHLRRWRPAVAEKLRRLAWTPASPGLPLITRGAADAGWIEGLRKALDVAAREPGLAKARADLRLLGFARLDLGDYEAVLDLERQAVRLGYPVLA